MTTLLSRYRGCMLGLAAGDALGAPVEFMSWGDIKTKYGGGGIRDFAPGQYGLGRITDDTQMTVATAKALLKVAAAGAAASGGFTSADGTMRSEATIRAVYSAYLDWFQSQKDPAQRRGPGNTCLSALGSGEMGTVDSPINDSKGCGGVMRVAPVGLACPGRPEQAFQLGAATAAITHGHPGGYLPAGFLAAFIARMVGRTGTKPDGRASLEAIVRVTLGGIEGEIDGDTGRLIARAAELARAGAEPREAFAELGEGWTGDEALAIALFATLSHPDSFEEAVITAVNHSGDSDSTGSLAGAIMGAYLGEDAVPRRWLVQLEGRDELIGLAERLHERFATSGFAPSSASGATASPRRGNRR